MIIYINDEYKCFTSKAEGYKAVDTAFFDGKCAEFIEGYRFVPEGETWVREDGAVFKGEMIAPWKPVSALEAAQVEFEINDMREALELLGVKENE